MKSKLRISAFLLAMVVFISATGHVFIAHYCAMEQTGCMEESDCCCADEKSFDNSGFESNAVCCVNSMQYLINPFSVRQPEKQITLLKIVACEIMLPVFSYNNHIFSVDISKVFTDHVSPPGKPDLLTMISTFQI